MKAKMVIFFCSLTHNVSMDSFQLEKNSVWLLPERNRVSLCQSLTGMRLQKSDSPHPRKYLVGASQHTSLPAYCVVNNRGGRSWEPHWTCVLQEHRDVIQTFWWENQVDRQVLGLTSAVSRCLISKRKFMFSQEAPLVRKCYIFKHAQKNNFFCLEIL